MSKLDIISFISVFVFNFTFYNIGKFILEREGSDNPILIVMGIAFLSASIYIRITNIKNTPKTFKKIKSIFKS